MKIMVEGKQCEIIVVDDKGTEWTKDFIGNNGGWEFIAFNEETGFYETDKETFAWWSDAADQQNNLTALCKRAEEKHGYDAVCEAIQDTDDIDLLDSIYTMRQAVEALDEEA